MVRLTINKLLSEQVMDYKTGSTDNIYTVNINNDSFIDFIAHFWCDSQTPAEIDTEDGAL